MGAFQPLMCPIAVLGNCSIWRSITCVCFQHQQKNGRSLCLPWDDITRHSRWHACPYSNSKCRQSCCFSAVSEKQDKPQSTPAEPKVIALACCQLEEQGSWYCNLWLVLCVPYFCKEKVFNIQHNASVSFLSLHFCPKDCLFQLMLGKHKDFYLVANDADL